MITKEWLKEYIWTVGAIIYVAFMFPVFVQYAFFHETGFGVFDIIATIGGLIVVCQMFLAAIPKEPSMEQVKRAKERGEPLSTSSS